MKKALLIFLSAFFGIFIGFSAAFFAWTKFTEFGLNARLLGDSTQDLAMLQSLESRDFDLALSLSKARSNSSLVGLSATFKNLSSTEKQKAQRLLEKGKRLGIEIPTDIK